MDVNEVRIAVMVVSLFLFLGVVWWAYTPKRRGLLDSIGRHILDDDEGTTAIPMAERSAP